ncbi:50S ribosomal protein L19 [Candidatus Parcubacteria bacterium]|nr:50S ribosomal protein L19 [Candidatus Parcubacteria bacterium]
MTVTLQEFNHSRTRTDMPNIKPGHVVKVYQKIVEIKGVGKKAETKERIQIFEGLVLGRKGGTGINATITVRKISGGIGVERIFPINAPTIEKIELVKITKTRRAKLNYMRDRIGKATKPKGELVDPKENMVGMEEKVSEEIAETKDEAETEIKTDSKEVKAVEEDKKEVVAKKEEKAVDDKKEAIKEEKE